MKTSLPRTGSDTETEHSPSANWVTLALPKVLKSSEQIFSARAGLELPVKTLISLPCEIISLYPPYYVLSHFITVAAWSYCVDFIITPCFKNWNRKPYFSVTKYR